MENKQIKSLISNFIVVMILLAITSTVQANSKTRIIKTGDVVMGIAVDLNRNGEIDFETKQPRVNKDGVIVEANSATDKTHPSLPYRFWINNDYDVVSSFGSIRLDKTDCIDFNDYNADEYQQGCEQWDEEPVQKTNLTILNKIESNRDLEDFSPLDINISPTADTDKYYWQLKAVGVSINIFSRYISEPEAHAYIFDTPTTIIQTARANTASTGHFMTLIAGDTSKKLTDKQINDFFDATGRGAFIFEGISACEVEVANCYIELSLRNKKDNKPIKVDQVYLDLHDITDFYQHITAGTAQDKSDTYQPVNEFGDFIAPVQNAFHAKYYGTMDTVHERELHLYQGLYSANSIAEDRVLQVHGWRMLDDEKISFSQTSFKRLYWSGYKGQFTAFSWPTGWFDKPAHVYSNIGVLAYVLGNERNYNKSEVVARQVAIDLADYLSNFKTSFPAIKTHIIAHSMGNVVVSEALNLLEGNFAESYSASQAAESAGAYDSNVADNVHTFKFSSFLNFITCPATDNDLLPVVEAWRCYNQDNTISEVEKTDYDMPPDMWRNDLILKDLSDEPVVDTDGNYTVRHGRTAAANMPANTQGQHYYKNLKNKVSRIFSLYNAQDVAIAAWEFNQLTKPDFLGGPTWFYTNTYLNNLSDYYAICDPDCDEPPGIPVEVESEFQRGGIKVPVNSATMSDILAFGVPARTKALGQIPVGDTVGNKSEIPSLRNFNLLGFTDSNQDHSAEFHGYYSEISSKGQGVPEQRASYWNTIVTISLELDDTSLTGLKNTIPTSE